MKVGKPFLVFLLFDLSRVATLVIINVDYSFLDLTSFSPLAGMLPIYTGACSHS